MSCGANTDDLATQKLVEHQTPLSLIASNETSLVEVKKLAQKNKIYPKIVKRRLFKQLQKGKSALYNNAFDIETYKFVEEDLIATIPVIQKALKDYQTPDKSTFEKKVKVVFGREIEWDDATPYLFIDFSNKELVDPRFSRNDSSINLRPLTFFVLKEQRLLVSLYALPQLFDYKNVYPDLVEYEKRMTIHIKDEEGAPLKIHRWLDDDRVDFDQNLERIMIRNRFLFGKPSPEDMDWLLDFDQAFLHGLSGTFGYFGNKAHEEWYYMHEEEQFW